MVAVTNDLGVLGVVLSDFMSDPSPSQNVQHGFGVHKEIVWQNTLSLLLPVLPQPCAQCLSTDQLPQGKGTDPKGLPCMHAPRASTSNLTLTTTATGLLAPQRIRSSALTRVPPQSPTALHLGKGGGTFSSPPLCLITLLLERETQENLQIILAVPERMSVLWYPQMTQLSRGQSDLSSLSHNISWKRVSLDTYLMAVH